MLHATCYTLILCLLAPWGLPAAQDDWKNVGRVVAIGDIHGEYDGFVEVLRSAGLIDRKNHWTGGKTHLVQTGDVPDRGANSRKAMDLLRDLEKEAAKAGGRVHALIGNHEAMNMYGDLRYTVAGEFAAFATPDSERVRSFFWKQEESKAPPPTADDRVKWESEHPLGWFEHRFEFSPKGTYGKWILSHNAIVKINDTIFLHGGISPRYASMPAQEINKAILAELKEFTKLAPTGPVMGEDGPLWYRGLAQDEEATLAAHVDQVLAAFGARRMVIGHTPTAGALIPRFDGKVVLIDAGMNALYGGQRAALLLEGNSAYAIHRGTKLELPSSRAAIMGYLKKALALEPSGSPLFKFVKEQEAAANAR